MHIKPTRQIGESQSTRILPDGIHLAPISDNDIWRNVEAAKTFPHDYSWWPTVVPLLPKTGTIIDCGAFIGDHSQLMQSAGYDVVAIEPFFDSFLCLCYNSPGSMNILGAAGDGRKVKLNMEPISGGDNFGMRWVMLDESGEPTIRLDDLALKDVVFIKIDVEGHEPFVINGALETIKKFRPVLLVESFEGALEKNGFSHKLLEDHLRSLGCEPKMVGGPPRWDWLCVF